ncbi:hypothetical protein [Sphaerisporangium sp. TRM90804]|uniref:hypothetical protein n=1 Tax=Sphaerisporangium sp. TRM90804 TaxID=3031113 RepID=UPI0024483638|nr:hypothetical protein [Sphaerisporangium sp. TRM90804]MDH2424509.1 hypothetical protein [Sphaerisporangium sp. TRM90804]
MYATKLRLAGLSVGVAALVGAGTVASADVPGGPACAGPGPDPICAEPAAVREAYEVVRALAWHPRARQATLLGYPARDGASLRVAFGPADRDVARALKERLGRRVSLEEKAPARLKGSLTGARAGDASPHWGGAEIQVATTTCTSGFTVLLPGGARGSVSAGHCFDDGDGLASGPHYFGTAQGENGYPAFDMIAVAGGGAYTNKIYTDPGSPISRTVTGKADPALGASVCTSGRLTKAKCGGVVTSTVGFYLQGGGMTTNLLVISKPGSLIGQIGDSGGPVYTPSASGSGATINGMIIGGYPAGDTVFAHKVSTVESHLGVTVATTP